MGRGRDGRDIAVSSAERHPSWSCPGCLRGDCGGPRGSAGEGRQPFVPRDSPGAAHQRRSDDRGENAEGGASPHDRRPIRWAGSMAAGCTLLWGAVLLGLVVGGSGQGGAMGGGATVRIVEAPTTVSGRRLVVV